MLQEAELKRKAAKAAEAARSTQTGGGTGLRSRIPKAVNLGILDDRPVEGPKNQGRLGRARAALNRGAPTARGTLRTAGKVAAPLGKVALPVVSKVGPFAAGAQLFDIATEGIGAMGDSPEAEALRKEQVGKFGGGFSDVEYDPKTNEVTKEATALGTAGNVAGRVLKAQLDPGAALSAAAQGLFQIGEGDLKGFEAVDPLNTTEGEAAQKRAMREDESRLDFRRRALQETFSGLEGVGTEFAPSKFAGSLGERFLLGRAADPQFAEAEKDALMAIEAESAKRRGKTGNPKIDNPTYEDIIKRRQGATASDADKFFGPEDRAAFAQTARENPEFLMELFDADKDGKLSSQERRSIFDPEIGFKASLARSRQAQAEADIEEAREGAKALGRGGASIGKQLASFGRNVEQMASETAKAADDKEKSDAERLEARKLFARGLEGDFSYSDAPSSAFQNPETRQKLMVDAYKRGEELGLEPSQIRAFLRGKGLLDKGFSESYENFFNRNTQGGGLSIGKLGARRQVGSRGGAVSTAAGRQAQARRDDLARQIAMARMMGGLGTTQQPLFNPVDPNNQFGMVRPIVGYKMTMPPQPMYGAPIPVL
tara:strand:+ start:7663 stop:9459 length:1797 start_codon:yes stop_codon:yes gene_type:complete